jgi:hypothetical protein
MTIIQKNPLPAPLRPEDVAPNQAVIVKVKDVLVDVKSPQTRSGKSTVLLCWEFEGKGIYLNATSQENACEGFGSRDTEDWKDKPCPIIVVRSSFEDRESHQQIAGAKLWVAPAKDWPTLLKDAPKPTAKKPR